MNGQGRSQGVVEFALAAPVLLMLLFGIIDFSLLFSAWLLIQNVSRQAVRYAVTGQYNSAYCPNTDPNYNPSLHGGKTYTQYNANPPVPCQIDPALVKSATNPTGMSSSEQAELNSEMQDIARVPSIHDEAKNYLAGLLTNSAYLDQTYGSQSARNTAETIAGYLQVTVCSGRQITVNGVTTNEFYSIQGRTGTSTYSDCYLATGSQGANPYEDAGGPNDTVFVSVDFNNPFLTPFLQLVGLFQPSNTNWTMTHLESTQDGVVESFRTARMNTWNSNPGSTATNTFTVTLTPTKTNTPTITDTPTQTGTATDTATATQTGTLTPSPTLTPSITLTPSLTSTATPNCSLFDLGTWSATQSSNIPT
ncbi:MAG TPA: TadE family protein, partial [Anaerolineales bacterium]|nr:TadE family protein [Anaerolineales bacterium]